MEALHGDLVSLVPVVSSHVPQLRLIAATSEVRQRWGVFTEDWPFDDPELTCFTVLEGSTIRGFVQYGEENDPEYRHAAIDIFLDPAAHGRGLGRDTIHTVAVHLVKDRGHHRLVIDPAVDNEAAIRCYESVGFRKVGVMRSYERNRDGDGWHDNLLMDLLADELR